MPNLFQRIGGFFRRQEAQPVQEPQRSEPEREERRGFFSRVRDRVTGADRRREEEQREREREQVATERAELLRMREEIARERAELRRERAESAIREQVAMRYREREVREPGVSPVLSGIPAIMPLGPKGRDGAVYTTIAGNTVMNRLQEAASLEKRVSLRVHNENGWHDLFLNERGGPGRHKTARGMSAQYLLNQIGRGFDQWLEDGCSTDVSGGYEDIDGEADGYQLTVWG